MKVILYQPQIPQNTGNVVRTCSVTGTELVLVKPLGFSIANRHLKRAGLDYWEGINIEFIDNLEEYLSQTDATPYFFSSHAQKSYTSISFKGNDLLIFGSETFGLHENFRKKWPDNFYRIPMIENSRCLNLATSVGVVVYEGLRQLNFAVT